MTLYCDRIFTAGILFLIVATPFAFGTVHPWAYTTMEAIIFSLVIVWMAKRAILAREHGAWSTQQGTEKVRNSKSEIRNCAIPLALFIALALFQLVPLPPEWLRAISPNTYEAYTQILPGWPLRVPYSDLPVATEVGDQRSEVSGQKPEVGDQKSEVSDQPSVSSRDAGSQEQSAKGMEHGAKSTEQERSGKEQGAWNKEQAQSAEGGKGEPGTEISDGQSAIENLKSKIENSGVPSGSLLHAPNSLLPPTWLPLSLAPFLSKTDLLKLAAYAALFFLILLYPFEQPFAGFEFRSPNPEFFVLSPEQRFLRSVFLAILVTGLLVAAVGFIERFSWNGKILWFFVPYDWGAPMANGIPRASGPFVNPDHFANYLALIFPIALGCALFRTFMVSKTQENGFKIFCGFTAFLLFTGSLLSISRGGWISALLGIVIFAWLAPWDGRAQGAGSRERSRSRRSEVRGQRSASSSMLPARAARIARFSAITVCVLLIVSLFVVGSGGREQVDARLGKFSLNPL